MPVAPQFNDIIQMMRAMPSVADLPIETIRQTPVPVNPSPTPVDAVTNRDIQGPAGKIPIRIYRSGKSGNLPLVLFMHGGGFVVGGLDTHDEMARVITAETGCVTVSVDYRLAPENPFPAAPDDCFAALKWASANGRELGADPARLAVVGDSAGGNLAAVMALRTRDEKGPAIKGQVLIYPGVDMGSSFPPAPDGQYYIITPKDKDFYNRSYFKDPKDLRNPLASPILAESHKGLPAALVITAEYDPLCAQGEAYAQKLKQAGVAVTQTRYAGAVHGFMSFPVPMAKQGLDEVAGWLNARL